MSDKTKFIILLALLCLTLALLFVQFNFAGRLSGL